ncbi:MAG TPA: hypothetical protein VFN67_41750, partial [Polyangiales bacterium]|nr:hypothetical protein [Polyangiales bacterium]
MAKQSVLLMAVALGCGGAASDAQAPSQSGTPGANAPAAGPGDQSNAPSLVVQMSMVLPKKMPTPAVTTVQPPSQLPGAGGLPQGASGLPMTAGPGASLPMGSTPTAAGGTAAPPAGAAGSPATTMTAAAGGGAPPGTAAGAETSGVPEAELAMLREICVAEINMYRAMLTDKMLMPLKRATPEQEECSQRAAKMDGDTMSAHGAFKAGVC